MRFEGKVAFITGGAVGFGRAFARALAAEGGVDAERIDEVITMAGGSDDDGREIKDRDAERREARQGATNAVEVAEGRPITAGIGAEAQVCRGIGGKAIDENRVDDGVAEPIGEFVLGGRLAKKNLAVVWTNRPAVLQQK